MNALKEKYGPVAVITGASSGIGKAFAEALALQGFDLVLVARRAALLKSIQDDLQSRLGVSVIALTQDLTDPSAPQTIYKQVAELGLDVGLLVNNAGYGSYGTFESLPLESELAMIDLACRAMMELTYRWIPDLKRRGRGGIIFLSSIVSQFPSPYMATYSAGKAFDFALANALYGELRPQGIDVLGLLPGTTATEFFEVAGMKRMDFLKATPPQVVQTALRALGRKPYVIHGYVNKLLVFFTKFLPMRWLIRIARFALQPR